MTTTPTTTLFDQWSAGWEQAQSAASQWWDLSLAASDQLRKAMEGQPSPATARSGAHHHDRGDHHEHDRHQHDRHQHDHRQHDHRRCGCSEPDHGSCCDDGCRCCIPEADVVLHARANERRVVPFTVHNDTRRTRAVNLAVGPFHHCSGDALEVKATFLEGEAITLDPCQKLLVHLMVAVAPATSDTKDAAAGVIKEPAGVRPVAGAGKATVGDRTVTQRSYVDVERCSTVYADVRFEGCGRPMRLAVVVLPGECDAVAVPCGCGCCC